MSSHATHVDVVPGRDMAVAAQSLFLANLLLAPGLSFLLLAWLWYRHEAQPALARLHLRQTFYASLWAGLLLVAFTAGFLLLGGLDSVWSWVLAIVYFVCIHATLVVLGILGLSRAMAGQPFRFPLIGPPQRVG